MASNYLEPLSSTSKILLDQNKLYLCGNDKSDEIDIQIDHPSVSRRHCIFNVTEKGLQIIDLGSSRGTFINGIKIPPKTLKSYAGHDDIIGIASKATKMIGSSTPPVYRLKLSDNIKKGLGQKRKSDGDSTSVSEKIARSSGIVDNSPTPESINISRLTEPIKNNVTTQTPSSFHDVFTHNEKNLPGTSQSRNSNECTSNKNSQQSHKKMNTILNKFPEILHPILNWKLSSKLFKATEFPLHSLAYTHYTDYYKTMSSIIILETWEYIQKNNDQQKEREDESHNLSVEIKKDSITPIHSTKLNLVKFNVTENFCDKSKQIDNKFYLKVGDLVELELLTISENENQLRRILAYIDIKETKLTSMITMSLPPSTNFNQTHKLKKLVNLRHQIYLAHAVENSKFNQFMNNIIKPDSNNKIYTISERRNSRINSTVIGEKLNDEQWKVVASISDIIIERDSKICLVEGPTGTGKSRVIVNLITEIMYDQRHTRENRVKILVCAPSNVAVDKITMRLLKVQTEFKNKNSRELFQIVRVGNPDKVGESEVRLITLNELVKKESESVKAMKNYRTKIKEIQQELKSKIDILPSDECKSLLSKEYADNESKLRELDNNIIKQNNLENNNFEEQINKKIEILSNADIITSTLSSSYSTDMERVFGEKSSPTFDVCIIDEASICNEPESLIPLMLGVKQLILVGDLKQKPQRNYTPQVEDLKYDKSLFSRIYECLNSSSQNITLFRLSLRE